MIGLVIKIYSKINVMFKWKEALKFNVNHRVLQLKHAPNQKKN